MASHGEMGALAGMDSEFGPISSSFLSTQPVHMHMKGKIMPVRKQDMCPILTCITSVPTLTPFSIIYGFAYLFIQLHLFLPVFSLHAFPLKNVELPLHITVFPDTPNISLVTK